MMLCHCFSYRFLPTVNLKRNSHDPRNPPKIVFNGVAANQALLNCMSDKIISARTEDRTAETGVDTAGKSSLRKNRIIQ